MYILKIENYRLGEREEREGDDEGEEEENVGRKRGLKAARNINNIENCRIKSEVKVGIGKGGERWMMREKRKKTREENED